MATAKTIGLWVLKGVVAALFVAAATFKLSGQPMMVDEFAKVGLGQGFRYFTGVMELGGAALLLWPKTSPIGALMLACVCAGAEVANLTVLHADPIHAVVLLAITLFIAWVERAKLPIGRAQAA